MKDDIIYHASPEEEPLAAPDEMARVNLFERLEEAQRAAHVRAETPPPPEPPAPPEPSPSEVYASTPAPSDTPAQRISRRLLAGATVLLVAVGAGGAYAYHLNQKPPQTAVTPADQSKPPTRSPSPKPRPSVRPSPSVKPSTPPRPPQPPPAQPGTYTVRPGDTLITIGEKLKKDWRAIAAANGSIANPNRIEPGQVLRIP